MCIAKWSKSGSTKAKVDVDTESTDTEEESDELDEINGDGSSSGSDLGDTTRTSPHTFLFSFNYLSSSLSSVIDSSSCHRLTKP